MEQDKEINVREDGQASVGEATPVVTGEGIETVTTALPVVNGVAFDQQPQPGDNEPEPEFPSLMPKIVAAIEDRNCPLEEVSRLISLQMALVGDEQEWAAKKYRSNAFEYAIFMKGFDGRMKTLSTIAKNLEKGDLLRHRDILNFDGPKFTFIFEELVKTFKESCQAALGRDGETMVQSIMKHYRDFMAVREAEWRKAVDKIVSKAA